MQTFAYHVRHKNGWGTGCGPAPTHCHTCGNALPARKDEDCSTGYGCGESESVTDAEILVTCNAQSMKPGERVEQSPAICYACCALEDKRRMMETGRATLYLTRDKSGANSLTNWPGSLRFLARGMRKGFHNIAGTRYDVWFIGPDGHEWHAVQYGDNTQIAHCRRLKAAA